jgi:TonB family protein
MYHSIRQSQVLSRRAVVLGGIAGLHIVVISLIASGLGTRLAQLVDPPMKVGYVVDEVIPWEPPPPVDAPTLEAPATDLGPPPVVNVDFDPGATALTAPPLTPVPPRVESRPGPPPPVRLVGRNQLPNTSDFYPPALIRQGVEGAAVVRVCVDEKGVRRGEPVVEQSSGNTRLDEGAIGVARAGQYAHAVQGDTPVPVCHRIRIGFNLK